jgi:hypothetical protein
MSPRRHRGRFLVAALTALWTGSFVGATGLVLCVGTNGHRALEREHFGMECPTLASSQDTSAVSIRPSAECLDLPAAGTGPTALLSVDPDLAPTPTAAGRAASPEPAPRLETRLPGPIEARAGPPDVAQHLRSTVLLV